MTHKDSSIVIWDDIIMMLLALASGYILLLEYATSLPADQILWLDRIDIAIAFIFLAEFFIKLFMAESKAAFFKSNWWYLFASIPITTPTTQALRLLRLVRLVRLVRITIGVKELALYLRRFIQQTRLLYVLTIWCVIVFSGTVAFFIFEHGINPNVRNLFDGFWWTVATVTTVGYGDIYPMTIAGRIVGIVLMLVGIGTTAIFTALVASFLMRNKNE